MPARTWSVRCREVCRCAFSGGVPQRSLCVAVVVGIILNLINQGDVILGGGPINWVKLLLTFVVPYAVSTYGAVSYRLSLERQSS